MLRPVLVAFAVSVVVVTAGCATTPTTRGGSDEAEALGAAPPRTVVRRAPVDVKALVDAAPTTAGVAVDAAAAAAVSAAEAAGLVAVADPQLGRFARALLVMVAEQQTPSGLLAAEMADRLGVGGTPSHSFAIGPGSDATLAGEMASIAKALGAGTRVRIGAGTFEHEGQQVTLYAVTPTPLAFPVFERKRAAGETLTLTGTWADKARALKFYVDDGKGGVVSGDVDVDDAGAVSFSHALPATPGVVRLEFVSLDDAEVERDVYAVSLYVGDVPKIVDRDDKSAAVDAAAVVAAINAVRGDEKVAESALMKEALAQKDERAIRAHFARSGFLVRHLLTQSFSGVFSADEFTQMTRQSPWMRSMFARASQNAVGVVVEDQGAEGKLVRIFSGDVREAIHVPSEQKRALDGINRARAKAKQKALQKDDVVEPVLQAAVEKFCRGAADPKDQGALQVALDPTLRKRRYTTLATFTSTGDDIPGSSWARAFKEVTSADYNVAAVGACNGAHAVPGEKNAILVVVLLGKR